MLNRLSYDFKYCDSSETASTVILSSMPLKRAYGGKKGIQFKHQTVLFDPQIGPYQLLPLRVQVDVGVMAM